MVVQLKKQRPKPAITTTEQSIIPESPVKLQIQQLIGEEDPWTP